MNPKPENRRRSGRYEFQTEAKYSLHERGVVAQLGTGRILNISAGGVLIQTDRPLRLGRKVEVSVPWPGLYHDAERVRLSLSGQVIRVDSLRAAIRILSHQFTSRDAGFGAGRPAKSAATPAGSRLSPVDPARTARAI